jgi:hypothetical protein
MPTVVERLSRAFHRMRGICSWLRSVSTVKLGRGPNGCVRQRSAPGSEIGASAPPLGNAILSR